MNTKSFLAPGLILALALILAGSTWRGQAAPLRPEPPPPRAFDEGESEMPFLKMDRWQAAWPGGPAPTALADWSKIVFQSFRDENWEIYLANGDGSNQTRLTYNDVADIYPRLNRGCTRIAFVSRRTGNYEIFTMNPDGSGLAQLTFTGESEYSPFWSPDGSKLAFTSYRDGQAEIYVMNADGSGQTRLTWDAAYDGQPAWSPNGAMIAFMSRRAGDSVWVMNADGGGQTQLSAPRQYTQGPVWSPDGSQIAFDADGNNDNWNELWLMNADGSNQRQVYDPPEYQTDAWARSWSPDGRYIAFTRLSWTWYEGNLYWTYGYLDAWDSMGGNIMRFSSSGVDWYPDWQTTDAWAPASSVSALPAQSPGPFTVQWSGTDAGPSGVESYDIQVKDGAAGTWTDWRMGTTDTSASYPGLGGHTYYFRGRARDNAGNVEAWPSDHDTSTTVEAWPPDTAVKPLPAYSRGEITVNWKGHDPGGSGIKTYDVQYRQGPAESWTDWQMGTTATAASFTGTAGNTCYFRSRATDNAQNTEGWPAGDGDTSTIFYDWTMTSTVRDNRDTPLSGAMVTATL